MTRTPARWAATGKRRLDAALDRALGGYTPTITWTLALAYLAIGWGLVQQPARFSNTPSYANLIGYRSAPTWGAIYLACAVLLITWRLVWRERGVGFLAHFASTTLTTWWLGAFIIRWRTDHGTTVVNVVSWSLLLSLCVRSWRGVDEDEPAR